MAVKPLIPETTAGAEPPGYHDVYIDSVSTVMKMTDTTITSKPDTIAAVVLTPGPDINFPPSIRPPPQPPPTGTTRLTFPNSCPAAPFPSMKRPLVVYRIPLEKGRPTSMTKEDCCIPPGSSVDPGILIRPASPTTPFEFPFNLAKDTYWDFNVRPGGKQPPPHDSIKRVVGLMHVCGLKLDSDVSVTVLRTRGVIDTIDNPSLVDGGANIYITGILDLLVNVESIAPLPISVATTGGVASVDDCCTKKGLLQISLDDGSIYYQPYFYCKNAVETIISPQAIVAASDVLIRWMQTGHKDGSPGSVRFNSNSGLFSILLTLDYQDGLYYCPTDAFTVDRDPVWGNTPIIRRLVVPPLPVTRWHNDYVPVPPSTLTESELWMLRLGSPGEDQLDLMLGKVRGIPAEFKYHPFRHIDWKEEACIKKQNACKSAVRTTEVGRQFYMDFGFMRASSPDYNGTQHSGPRVVTSWDGFSSYLLIVDKAS